MPIISQVSRLPVCVAITGAIAVLLLCPQLPWVIMNCSAANMDYSKQRDVVKKVRNVFQVAWKTTSRDDSANSIQTRVVGYIGITRKLHSTSQAYLIL